MSNELYDFTLCVLSCTKKEKYAARLKEFDSIYGYKNKNKNIKVRIIYLVEDEERPEFIKENCFWIKSPGIPMSMRFIRYIKDLDNNSKWVMQVDDDSSTDIDKTFEILSQYYDHQDPVVLMGGRNTDLENSLQSLIKSFNIENFSFESTNISNFVDIPYFVHAWEPTIISQAGIKKIKQWKRLGEFFNTAQLNRPIFSDQFPYVVARMAKIPVCEALFLCPFERGHEFSGINLSGRYSHIHYVTEKWKHFDAFKKALSKELIFKNSSEANNYFNNDFRKIDSDRQLTKKMPIVSSNHGKHLSPKAHSYLKGLNVKNKNIAKRRSLG